MGPRTLVPEARWPRILVATAGVILSVLLVDSAYGAITAPRVTTAFFIGLTAIPFLVAIGYAGYWLDESPLDDEHRRRVGLWVFIGMALSLGMNLLLMQLFPDRSLVSYLGWARWALAVGGGIGAVLGIFEARSIHREILAERERVRNEDLEREKARLDEFASILTHDLRSPLNVAQGHLELATAGSGDDTHIQAARDALDRMDTMIDETLMLARSGLIIGDAEPVALERLARTCWQNVDTRSATLAVEDPPTVSADPNRLGQLFENLFRNAIEHGGDAVTVRVGALEDGPGFYVEDDGPGIAAEDRAEAFTVGYTTAADGTGFGLAIVEQIADAHDWTTTLTSSPSGGARFEFTGVAVATAPVHSQSAATD